MSASASPAETIAAYRVAYNADDIDALMQLFTESSVLTDHPAALFAGVGDGGRTLRGLESIRPANTVDRESAAPTGAYRFFDVEVTGDVVSWDHTWVASSLVEWCGEGHTATVVGGVFGAWTYAPAPHLCRPDCPPADVSGERAAPEVCRRRSP